MSREVNALELLSTTDALVPEFISSNISDTLNDEAIRPFVAMEFIVGPTLLKFMRKNGGLRLEQAIDVTQKLSESVGIAHSESTFHRDIKPQNIVLKAGDLMEPYLIDFGLSFNAVVNEQDDLTSIHETIGNKFQQLPEASEVGSEFKHESVSDVTLVSGIFLSLLIGEFPVKLHTELAEYPHRRLHNLLQEAHGESLQYLEQFFDRAFQYDMTKRFQTIAELQARLIRIVDQVEGNLLDVDPIASVSELVSKIAPVSRSYQISELKKRHSECGKAFFGYLRGLIKKPEINPVQLTVGNTRVGIKQGEIGALEVLDLITPLITVRIPSYYTGVAWCRYVLIPSGDEISIGFQAVIYENEVIRTRDKIFNDSAVQYLHSFYDWTQVEDEYVKKHSNSWFHEVVTAISSAALKPD